MTEISEKVQESLDNAVFRSSAGGKKNQKIKQTNKQQDLTVIQKTNASEDCNFADMPSKVAGLEK